MDKKLFKKAKEPKVSCWLEGVNHNYMPPAAEEKYWLEISTFTNLINI